MKKISPEGMKVLGPYSPAVQCGDFVFISGQLGLDPETMELVSQDFQAQLRQLFDNTKSLLDQLGLSVHHFVQARIFMTNLQDFPLLNEQYAQFLEGHCPARTTVEVQALPKGAKVEIEWVATLSIH